MSDPFADLLSSFKSGGSLPASKKSTPVPQQEELPRAHRDDVHNDLDQLFGSQKVQEGTVRDLPVTDSFDAAFEAFSQPPEVVPVPEVEQEMIVDEVRDMEVAKLMSLGLDIEQASESYEKGVLYEHLVEQRKRKEARRSLQREKRPVERQENGSLFSLASGLFEKGKQFVDQVSESLQGDEQGLDRLSQLRLRSESLREPQPRPVTRHTPEPVSDLEEGGLFQEFQQKVDLNKSPGSPIPPPEATLLDFDYEEQPSERIKSITPVPISNLELSGYSEYKDRGTEFFKAGDYVSASEEYEKSFNSLPQNHTLRIVACSNLTAALSKQGEYKRCISDINCVLELFPEDWSSWDQPIQSSQPIKTFKEMWSKIITRRAEAYEHTENYEKAFQDYQSLIEKNFFNDKIMQGKRRCQKVLNPPQKKNTAPRKSSPAVSSSSTKKPIDSTTKVNANVERVKQENQMKEAQDAQRAELYDKVFDQIEAWKGGKGDDIRHLLANLPMVLTWCDWKPVSTADLIMPKKVKVTYMKAVAKTHPDKIPSSLDLDKKMIAENVFSSLSTAWEKFKTANNVS